MDIRAMLAEVPLFGQSLDPEQLDALATKFRRPVELVDIGGLSYQEAADQLGVPVGTVMSRLHRARKKIREHLDDAGFGRREIN